MIESVRCPLAWPRQQGKHFTDGDRFADVAPPTEAESRAWLGLDPVADPSGRSSALTIHLRLMSVNVQTLNSVAKGVPDVGNDDFSGRAAYLREQCEYHGANVVALQETRSRHSETINSQSHIRLCSGRDAQGHHGVELWFARNLAISTCATDPLRVQLSDLLVLHADPRLLIVRLSRRSLHVLFVAVHAPIAADPRRDQWWKDLSTRLARYSRGSWVVLLGDFNVHFGSPIAHRIGDLVWSGPGSVPDGLRDILDRHDLWVPSTFRHCHHGPSATWVAPNGLHSSRIDFIAVPSHWGAAQGSSQVHRDLDWGQAHVDHYAIRLDTSSLRIWCGHPATAPSRSTGTLWLRRKASASFLRFGRPHLLGVPMSIGIGMR